MKKKKIEIQKRYALAMILLGVLLLITISIFLYYTVLKIQGIPEFLPSQNTAFFIAFDKTGFTDEDKNSKFLKNLLNYIFEKEVPKYERGAFALLKSNTKDKNLLPAFLFETKKQAKPAKELLSMDNYIVASKSEEALRQIKEAVKSKESLANNTAFIQISQKLPKISLISFALDPRLLNVNPILDSFQIIKGNLTVQSGSPPLWHIGGLFKTSKNYSNLGRYQGKLLNLFPPFPEFFLAGENLASRINLFESDMRFSLQKFLETYGANELDAEEDILPLLNGEYGLSVYELEEARQFLFILEFKNAEKFRQNIEKIKMKIPAVLSILMPQIREVVLPDKTVGKEVFADPQNIVVENKIIGDMPSVIYTVKHKNFSIFVAEKNNLLFIGTDEKTLLGDKNNNLMKSPVYINSIKEVLRGSNEILYMNKGFLKNLMSDNAPKWLESGLGLAYIKGFSASLRYSEDVLEMFISLMIS